MKKKNNNNSNKNDSRSEYYNSDDSDSDTSDDDDSQIIDVLNNYLFPSFFVFVAHGSFVPADERLDILVMDNKHKKKGEGTQAELRKKISRSVN